MAADPVPVLSLNQRTTNGWSLREALDGCVRAGITAIGLWRDKVEAVGVEVAARMVADSGLTVTSLCRGGFFSSPGAADDNLRALDEAAALGAPVLVLVPGGLPPGSRDLAGARRQVAAGVAALVEPAAARHVRLALEPMHPMFCADRGVICSLDQALDVVEPLPETAGVALDTYHVWWDPTVADGIRRAAGRLALVQAADWSTGPLPQGALLGRVHVGDGCADIAGIVRLAYSHGYEGPLEVELFNQEIWDAPGDETLRLMVQRHQVTFAGAG
ncbi:MAG TPA: sugar phosphate isomerase/epimerase family protein [Acidimicrobiales bacterium]|nr:sugar phosphate isomerase/epimerase family protein [Acidimicrobiales bacterium]